MSVTTVQRWVLTVLSFSIIEHLALGLGAAGVLASVEHPGSRIGLLVIAGIVSTIGIEVVLVIHGRRRVSAWLLLGLVIPLAGAVTAFWR